MATIIIRNSTGSGAVPSSLVQGELAINTIDGKLFYGSGSGNIVKEFTGSGGGGGSTFPFTGSAVITGSLVITGSTTSTGGFTGSLFGTASFANTALTASFINTASTNAFVQGGNSFGAQALLGTNDNQSLAFETSGSVRMFISSSGIVGIGTIIPSASLHVIGDTLIQGTSVNFGNAGFALRTNSGNVNLGFFAADNLAGAGLPGFGIYDSINARNILAIRTGAPTNSFYLSNNGNLAIGYTSLTDAGFKLDIMGSGRFTNNLTVTGSTTLHNGQTTIQGAGATSATTALLVRNSTPTNIITVLNNGLVGINRTPTASLDVAGTTRLSGSFNTAASGSILTVIGSGSAQPIFTVQGSQGELFSITDSLSGSLFSVNDISGLPILEVFSDNTTLIGDYQDPMLITTRKVTMTNSGSFVVYSLPTASYDTAFFDYSIKSGSNARAGQIMAIQSGASVNFTETTTTDFGSTTAVSFTVLVSGSNMVLTGSASTGSWTIKTIVRGL